MKRPALFLLVLLTATLAQSRPALQTPQTRELLETWLEGTVGTAAVRVFVERAGWPKSEGLWGMYYYTRYWGPIPLDGDWTSRRASGCSRATPRPPTGRGSICG